MVSSKFSVLCLIATVQCVYAEDNAVVMQKPIYKTIVSLPTGIAADEKSTIEIWRSADGVIEELGVATIGAPQIAKSRCGCVLISINPYICVTRSCGGGTFSIPDDTLAMQATPSDDGSNSMSIRATSIESGIETIINVPAFTVDATGQAHIVME